MTIDEANNNLKIIEELAWEMENDEALKNTDPRYAILAHWIDTDIENVS
jgi:hypothetical protein